MDISVKDVNTLADIYEALGGIYSEMGPEFFDHFYKGGGVKMGNDFERVLKHIGVRFG